MVLVVLPTRLSSRPPEPMMLTRNQRGGPDGVFGVGCISYAADPNDLRVRYGLRTLLCYGKLRTRET